MALDERARHELFLRLEQVLGPAPAETLMELMPPVGWADVADAGGVPPSLEFLGFLAGDIAADTDFLADLLG